MELKFELFDDARWSDTDAYRSVWQNRSIELVEMLPSTLTSLCDLGAGKCEVKKNCSKKIRYIAVDLTSAFGADVVLDLNAAFDVDALPEADAAIASGLLEYILDVPVFMGKLAQKYPIIAFSYNCVFRSADRKAKRNFRRNLGWVNDYTFSELASIIESAGYVISRMSHVEEKSSHDVRVLLKRF